MRAAAFMLAAVLAAPVLAQGTAPESSATSVSDNVVFSSPPPSSDDGPEPTDLATPTDEAETTSLATPTDDAGSAATGMMTLQVPANSTNVGSPTSSVVSAFYNVSSCYTGGPSPSANSTSYTGSGGSGLPPQPTSKTNAVPSSVPTAGGMATTGVFNMWLGLGVAVALTALQL